MSSVENQHFTHSHRHSHSTRPTVTHQHDDGWMDGMDEYREAHCFGVRY